MKPLVAMFVAFLTVSVVSPALAEEHEAARVAARDAKSAAWGVDLEKIRKIAEEKNCKDVVMYREVIPYFGMELTKKVSYDIAIAWEKEDIATGKAEVIDTKYDCSPWIGNLYVMCRTNVALCYFHPEKEGEARLEKAQGPKPQVEARSQTLSAKLGSTPKVEK